MKRLTGIEAIEYAEANALTLSKYTDPTEEARTGLTVEEALEIAAEDPILIWIDAPDSYRNPAAVALGRKGGAAKSDAKTAAVRANAKLGGRPKMQVIRSFNTALGGYNFRATGNNKNVNLQRKGPRASRFQTIATCSRQEWRENEMCEMSISDFAHFLRFIEKDSEMTYKQWKATF